MLNLPATQLDDIINSTLPYYIKNDMYRQADQSTPALKIFQEKKKTFPGGEGLKLIGTAAFDYTADWEIFSGEDPLSFNEMSNRKLFTYEGVENHLGLKIPYTALKAAGFMITDKNTKGSTDFSPASKSDALRITNFLQGKFEEMDFSSQQSFSKKRIWSDGSNGFAGLPALISQTPTTGVTGAISRSANSKWRNRALVGTSKISYSTTNFTLTNTIREEIRLLRVYGGKPDAVFVGNKAFKAFEAEIYAKGTLTQEGFKNGNTDIGIKGISLVGLPPIIHEPAMDDLGLTNFCYIVDTSAIALTMLEGDDMTVHMPARPYDRMAGYKSITWTGMLVATKLNSSGVYEINTAGL